MSKKICGICGREYDLEDLDLNLDLPKRMIEKKICFSCAHWDRNHELDLSSRKIEGVPVILNKFNEMTVNFNPRDHWFIPFRVCHGENCSIHPLDTLQPTYRVLMFEGRLYTVNNMWHQGEIPTVWFDKFKVNAMLLDNERARYLISRIDTKVSEDLTHYIISNKAMKEILI